MTFSLVLFFGGLLLLGYAFSFEGFEIVTYLGGILCTALGVFSSSTIIKIMDGA
ncbi:hypothetical protein [Humidisolicoccus flavus]|uniref:hypothetical protein n=1 Tax=Humidisolicoccus flavus TaxID=3111414 RepID=UPI00324F06D2